MVLVLLDSSCHSRNKGIKLTGKVIPRQLSNLSVGLFVDNHVKKIN
jgi:hypothetical protein